MREILVTIIVLVFSVFAVNAQNQKEINPLQLDLISLFIGLINWAQNKRNKERERG